MHADVQIMVETSSQVCDSVILNFLLDTQSLPFMPKNSLVFPCPLLLQTFSFGREEQSLFKFFLRVLLFYKYDGLP